GHAHGDVPWDERAIRAERCEAGGGTTLAQPRRMTTNFGPEIERFTFRAWLAIAPVLLLVGVGSLAGLLKGGGPALIAIAAGSLFWGWPSLAHAPRRLSIREGGFVLHRGFHAEDIPWARVERVVFGTPPRGRHGVHVTIAGARGFSILSGNAGKKRTRTIA